MPFFSKFFDRLVEHEFRWASTLFKILLWWIGALFVLIAGFYLLYRMKTMLAAIPSVIQAACLILVVMAVLLLVGMFRERNRALAAYERFLAALADVKPASERERANGLSAEKMAAIRRKAVLLPGKPREWWSAIEESLEPYTSINGEEGFFLTRSVSECLPEEQVVDPFYHSRFHESVPGILTALGLLATFVAILMALAGVTYNVRDPLHPVSGIDQLINGLSGKFLSSIIALLLSVVFTVLERKACEQPLRDAYDALIKRCKDVFPFLTQSRILLDIQRIAMGQAREAAERG